MMGPSFKIVLLLWLATSQSAVQALNLRGGHGATEYSAHDSDTSLTVTVNGHGPAASDVAAAAAAAPMEDDADLKEAAALHISGAEVDGEDEVSQEDEDDKIEDEMEHEDEDEEKNIDQAMHDSDDAEAKDKKEMDDELAEEEKKNKEADDAEGEGDEDDNGSDDGDSEDSEDTEGDDDSEDEDEDENEDKDEDKDASSSSADGDGVEDEEEDETDGEATNDREKRLDGEESKSKSKSKSKGKEVRNPDDTRDLGKRPNGNPSVKRTAAQKRRAASRDLEKSRAVAEARADEKGTPSKHSGKTPDSKHSSYIDEPADGSVRDIASPSRSGTGKLLKQLSDEVDRKPEQGAQLDYDPTRPDKAQFNEEKGNGEDIGDPTGNPYTMESDAPAGNTGVSTEKSSSTTSSKSSSSKSSSTKSSSSSSASSTSSSSGSGSAAAAASASKSRIITTKEKVVVGNTCELCRRMVLLGAPRNETNTTQIMTPCKTADYTMNGACKAYFNEHEKKIVTALDPDYICGKVLNMCEAKEIIVVKEVERKKALGLTPDGKPAGKKTMLAGTVHLSKEDPEFKQMAVGSGKRRTLQRVQFDAPFLENPTIHVGLSQMAFNDVGDAVLKVRAVNIDLWGFDMEVWTWKNARVEMAGLNWLAYGKALSMAGQVHSGRVQTVAIEQGAFSRTVLFPNSFNDVPAVSVVLSGVDAATGRDVDVSVSADSITKNGFKLRAVPGARSIVRWVSMSWLAFNVRETNMNGGKVNTDAKADPRFKNFMYPPLGPRSYEVDVKFASSEELRCAELKKSDAGTGTAPPTTLTSMVSMGATVAAASKSKSHASAGDGSAGVPLGKLGKGLLVIAPSASCPQGGAFTKKGSVAVDLEGAECVDGTATGRECVYSLCETTQETAMVPGLKLPGGFGQCTLPLKTLGQVNIVTESESHCAVMAGKSLGPMLPAGYKCALSFCDPDPKAPSMALPAYAASFKNPREDCPLPFGKAGNVQLQLASEKECTDAGGRAKGKSPGRADDRVLCQFAMCFEARGVVSLLSPAQVEFGLATKVALPKLDAGSKVWFVYKGTSKCPGAAKNAVTVDSDGTVTLPPLAVDVYKTCYASAGANSDDQFQSSRLWQLTVRTADVSTVEPIVKPMPVGVNTPIDVRGLSTVAGNVIAFLPTSVIGCQGAASDAEDGKPVGGHEITESMQVSAKLPYGSYKVCFGTKGASRDQDFVEQRRRLYVGWEGDEAERAEAEAKKKAAAAALASCDNVPPPAHYDSAPVVRVALSSVNTKALQGPKIEVHAGKVTPQGFVLRVSTYGNARTETLGVSWTANELPPAPKAAAAPTHAHNPKQPNSEANPGQSCAIIKEEMAKIPKPTPDGPYWIDLNGKSVQMYCDMRNGGWTRVMNIHPQSRFHADEPAEVSLGDLDSAEKAAKLSDTDITAMTARGPGYWRFECGSYQAMLKTKSKKFTSVLKNSESWEISRAQDPKLWECKASYPGYGFSEQQSTDLRCSKGFVRYASFAAKEGQGCYHDGEGWGQAGALWVK